MGLGRGGLGDGGWRSPGRGGTGGGDRGWFCGLGWLGLVVGPGAGETWFWKRVGNPVLLR